MTSAVLLKIVADPRAIAQSHVLLENGTANLALPAESAIIENDRIFDNRSAVNVDTSPEYRTSTLSARENASTRNDGTYRFGLLSVLAKSELRTRVRITSG